MFARSSGSVRVELSEQYPAYACDVAEPSIKANMS